MSDLRLISPARDDLVRQAIWYDNQKDGLGASFLLSAEAAFSSLRRFPGQGDRYHGDFRRKLIKRFPFGIFYRDLEAMIIVYAVLHQHLDPLQIRRSLDDPQRSS